MPHASQAGSVVLPVHLVKEMGHASVAADWALPFTRDRR